MKPIFIGLIFMSINFHLDINAARIGLIPDFVGYFFMLQGLNELLPHSGHFTKLMPFVKGMLIYSAVLYAADLFGLWRWNFYFGTGAHGIIVLVGIVTTVLTLSVLHRLLQGVREMETNLSVQLNSVQLGTAWKVMAICAAVSYVILLGSPVISALALLIGFVGRVLYIVAFWQAWKLFDARPVNTDDYAI